MLRRNVSLSPLCVEVVALFDVMFENHHYFCVNSIGLYRFFLYICTQK